MKIYIDRISEAGLELTETRDPASLDLERADVKFREPLNLTARASKGIKNVSVHLQIKGSAHLSCSRCLEEFVIPLARETDFNFHIEHEKIVDLTGNVRDEIILSYPLQPLCRPDCLGLCPRCGKNLNQGPCNCNSHELKKNN